MIIFGFFILGLALGSFVNALVWRLYQQDLPEKMRAASLDDLSISKGRSMCPHCKHTLSAFDLVPVFSWVMLRGSCRYCKRRISAQYPLVELTTAALFVISYIFWPSDLAALPNQIMFGLWLMFSVGLVALAVYDIKWMLLPNKIVFPLTGIAVVKVIAEMFSSTNPFQVFILAVGGLAIAGGIFYVLFQLSNGAWIGGGDVKLGFALGLMLGSPFLAFLMLFIASVFGLVASIPSITSKKALQRRVPFGPSLIAATIVVVLFGQNIIDWYSATFLII